MRLYGLIGFPLGHSLSERYFKTKFREEKIPDTDYRLFPIRDIGELPAVLDENPDLAGLNVTIPYKISVMKFLDETDEIAETIGAVNTIKVIHHAGRIRLKGYNTDIDGLEGALSKHLKKRHNRALILGSGGVSRVAQYFCARHNISYSVVSRDASRGKYTYRDLTTKKISDHLLIINTTPVGMHPSTDEFPPIPYEALTDRHLVFDMIYNPDVTRFIEKSENNGAETAGGLSMFRIQAESSWKIWNE